jgi:hypothetical protein
VFLANGMLFGLASLTRCRRCALIADEVGRGRADEHQGEQNTDNDVSSGWAMMSASLTAVVCIRPMPRVAGRE